MLMDKSFILVDILWNMGLWGLAFVNLFDDDHKHFSHTFYDILKP
jgi:hypothetical protein